MNRREMLRLSAISATGVALAACGVGGVPTQQQPATEGAAAAGSASPAAEVTLNVMAPVAEYEAPYREIWNVFEVEHPGIKINLFSVNEDTAAAHEAKVAGGFLPAIEHSQELQVLANKDNYEMFTDLSSFEFPWWDRFTFPAQTDWSDLYSLPGPRTLDIYQGFVFTWQYNEELMEKAGLDPRKDIKTWDDLKKWLDEGTKWANAEPDVDYFWNQGWHNWVFGVNYVDMIPLAFADGGRDRQRDAYLGRAKFNDPDSPYRHFFEFFKEANDKGWIPENMWTRQWEGDMETSYIASKSVMMLHGPWVWDKALAAGSEFAVNGHQNGFPMTPPADGQDWVQGALPPSIDAGFFMRAGNQDTPHWNETMTAWNWLHSPEAIPMRAQAEGRFPLYKTDEPVDIQGPQYQALLKDIDNPDGAFSQVKWEQSQTGAIAAGPYLKKGAKGVWDWQSNGNNQVMADVLSGKISVQDALDIAQRNWEESYDIPDEVKNG